MSILDFLNENGEYVQQIKSYLESQGLSPAWSSAAAGLYLLLHAYGLGPTITSIYRSPEKQAEMLAAWNHGDRKGLAYKPAVKSDHSHQKKNWLGQLIPDSLAMDIDLSSKNYEGAAYLAHLLGISTGWDYGDYVHYNWKA